MVPHWGDRFSAHISTTSRVMFEVMLKSVYTLCFKYNFGLNPAYLMMINTGIYYISKPRAYQPLSTNILGTKLVYGILFGAKANSHHNRFSYHAHIYAHIYGHQHRSF